MPVSIDLSGQGAIVFGVASARSIAWSIASFLHAADAKLTVTYQNERLKKPTLDLIRNLDGAAAVECDVTDHASIRHVFETAASESTITTVVHSVAFANREDLDGEFSQTSLDGFRLALDISAYSFIAVSKLASDYMEDGGSILTLTFQAAEKVYPGYNVMGVAKAALENEVLQLAAEFGPKKIRVNAISAGPLNTLAARGISGFSDMRRIHEERSPLGRNITQEEVGGTALFLASTLASGITGEIIYVDAGYHIMGV